VPGYMVVNAKLRLPALTAFLAHRAKKNEKNDPPFETND
ncbi:hypothetical protein TeGR_g9643, partial [Tetraparma gracilis]